MAARPARMEPIATLPVFFKLQGKRAILAGGGEPAAWKAELLSAAGADVAVLAVDPCEELVRLAEAAPLGPVTITRRTWVPADLVGAAVALGAIDDPEEAARFQAAARAAGVPVNVIDKPAFCDFQFGTIVARSPLVIGISTDGASPVLGQAIRARIEALLPHRLTAWAGAAKEWRSAIQARNLSFRARRRFWEIFSDFALAGFPEEPTSDVYNTALTGALDPSTDANTRRISLVGAGRGAADGITLQAIKALQDADEVFHTTSVSPTLIGFARREAQKTEVPADASSDGDFVAAKLRDGRRYAWLDFGNPRTCRRWRDRGDILERSGAAISVLEGLGQCPTCDPRCHAWGSD